jgi:subtilisin family serine protease
MAKNNFIELIINTGMPGVFKGRQPQPEFVKKLKAKGISFELKDFKGAEVSTLKAKGKGPSKLTLSNKKYVAKTNVSAAEINPWDLAHITNKNIETTQSYVEPDSNNELAVEDKLRGGFKGVDEELVEPSDDSDNFDPDWNPHKNIIWHLDDEYSQLKSARDAVMNTDGIIRIGHLDTGYGKGHPQLPPNLNLKLQKNFVKDEEANDASDRRINGLLKMPGHGTGTIGILAGNIYKTADGKFNDYLGGAPFAEIVPCRIANSVVLLKTSAFAEAIRYLTELTNNGTTIHVVSMSMGGVPSQTWADAVNAAYEAGITVVTAAGNNFNGLPTRKLIYPARFHRVIAACGVTYDYSPYHHNKLGEMQGNWGPARHMSKALAAFTPNTPWARLKTKTVSFSGAGTSSATPQIAAAAACYYKKYQKQLNALPEAWMRVEAIRNALYKTALKLVKFADDDYDVYFGNGIIHAKDALAVQVPSVSALQNMKCKSDDVPFFPLLSILFKEQKKPVNTQELQMFNVELAQLVHNNRDLQQLLDNDEKIFAALDMKARKKFMDAVIAKREASKTLRKFLQEYYDILSIAKLD